MAVKDYQDPRWQKVRLRIMERDGFKCKACGESKETLHVHHRAYEKKKKIWDANDYSLVTLCEKCHERAEEIVITMRKIADIIVFNENIGLIPFKIDERLQKMVSEKQFGLSDQNYFTFCFTQLDVITTQMIDFAVDFQEKSK